MTMRPGPRFAVSLWLCAALLAGCGQGPYLDDDEGAPQPARGLVGAQPDHLSLPYALGTKVRIAAVNLDGDLSKWQLRSDATSVLRVDKMSVEDRRVVADCTAAGAGEARLSLVDPGGAERKNAMVSVRAPDRARVFAHGPLRVLGVSATSFDSAEVREARVVVGGKGVFAVGYFRGEQRVYGRGLAGAPGPAEVTVENRTTPGFAATEWLVLSPTVAGSYMLKLAPGGIPVLSLPIVAVAEGDLASLRLLSEAPADPQRDQQVWVLGQARDRDGKDVYGVYLDWTLNGIMQSAQNGNSAEQKGDLYRYSYSPGGSQELVSGRGALRATLTVPASRGYVVRTTYLGCAAAPGRQGSQAPGLVALLAALLGLRRRAVARAKAPRPAPAP